MEPYQCQATEPERNPEEQQIGPADHPGPERDARADQVAESPCPLVPHAEPADCGQHGKPDGIAGDDRAVVADDRVAGKRERQGRGQGAGNDQRGKEVAEASTQNGQSDVHGQESRYGVRDKEMCQLAQEDVSDVPRHGHVVVLIERQRHRCKRGHPCPSCRNR